MRDIEERLRNAPVNEGPERLDRSIEQMIRWAEIEDASRRGVRRPLWFAVAGCAAGLLVGVLLGPLLHGSSESPISPPTTVVIIEPTPELERWLTTGSRQQGFFERTHGELETVYVAGASSDELPSSL